MTQLPKGVERDDTVHGRRYYSKAELMDDARRYAADQQARRPAHAPRPEPASSGSEVVDDLMGMMGLRR